MNIAGRTPFPVANRPGLARLRQALARIDRQARPVHGRIGMGHPGIDAALSGGLARGRLHAVGAVDADAGAAIAFVAGLAAMLAEGRGLLWVTARAAAMRLYGNGLMAHGVNPDALLLLQAADARAAARAAEDGARCAALGAVVLALPDQAAAMDLTAARRLQLAAGSSGVTILVLALGDAGAMAGGTGAVAETRWRVAAAPSAMLAGEAPGRPAMMLELQRQRGGPAGHCWRVEWNRDARSFEEAPLPGLVPAVPACRSQASGAGDAGGRRIAAAG